MRQRPPSRAGTMRASPGQADARGADGASETMNVCSKRDPGGLARARLRHRYTPPDRRARALCRQVSWLAGRHPRRPSRYKPVAVERGLAAYNCGGSHSFAVFPVRPESGTDERVYYARFWRAPDRFGGLRRAPRAAFKRGRIEIEDRRMSPWLTVVGIGEDGWAGIGRSARRALLAADAVYGGERHLALLARAHPCAARRMAEAVLDRTRSCANEAGRSACSRAATRCCSASARRSRGIWTSAS